MRYLVILAALALPVAAEAQPSAERGRDIVENGTQAGAAPCASCHGLDGLANGNAQFPRLDGQSAWYLFKQLGDYAGGSRKNEIMGPIAQSLTEQQRQDVAAYYGGLRFQAQAPAQPGTTPDAAQLQAGRSIVEVGIAERGVQACANCHGPEGAGLGPANPRLAGQWAEYARAQLSAFRSGTRQNDTAAVMRDLSRRLTDDDAAAVTAWLAQVRPGATAQVQPPTR